MNQAGFLLLCGGLSSRMGQCKALLPYRGRTFLDHVADAGRDCEERLFSVNDPSIATPEGYRRVPDLIPMGGPLCGIHAGLTAARSEMLITAPCDVPLFNARLAAWLADAFDPQEMDVLVLQEHSGRLQPLMGVYGKACLQPMEAFLMRGDRKQQLFLQTVRTKIVRLPDFADDSVFSNLNTPDEYRQFLSSQEQGS